MPGKTAECNNCHKLGHFARVCRSKTDHTGKRVTYTEEIYGNEEEESEPEEIRQITQINRIQPNKNDHCEIKLKINGKYQNFTIDTGSPVTIMPNNPTTQHSINKTISNRYKKDTKTWTKMKSNSWARSAYTPNTTAKLQNYQYPLHKETTLHLY